MENNIHAVTIVSLFCADPLSTHLATYLLSITSTEPITILKVGNGISYRIIKSQSSIEEAYIWVFIQCFNQMLISQWFSPFVLKMKL